MNRSKTLMGNRNLIGVEMVDEVPLVRSYTLMILSASLRTWCLIDLILC